MSFKRYLGSLGLFDRGCSKIVLLSEFFPSRRNRYGSAVWNRIAKIVQPGSTLTCSFCAKQQDRVRVLIAGPAASICDECTDLCHELCQKDAVDQTELYRTHYSEFRSAKEEILRAVLDSPNMIAVRVSDKQTGVKIRVDDKCLVNDIRGAIMFAGAFDELISEDCLSLIDDKSDSERFYQLTWKGLMAKFHNQIAR